MTDKLSPENITKPGWYYEIDLDECVKVEQEEILTYGSLRPRRGFDDKRMATGKEMVLTCNGSTYRPDWGSELIGPINFEKVLELEAENLRLKAELKELDENTLI